MASLIIRGGIEHKLVQTKPEREQRSIELTSCGLCHKDLFAPKNFPCLHSFCEMCVTDYVKNYKKEKKIKGHTPTVACPICETPTTFRSVDNPKEFAESLQTSTLMASLLSKKAERVRECNLCPSVEKQEGKYWCFYCAQALCDDHERYHKAVTSSKVKHPVYPMNNVRSVQDSIYKTQSCRFHETSTVAHFCMDHLNACCAVCWKRMHKVCNVIPIDQAARIVHKSRITLDLDQKIDYLHIKVKETIEERKELLDDIEKQRQSSMKAVKKFRKTLDNYIDSLQANLELDIENHYCQTKDKIQQEIHDFENKRSNFEHYQKLIKSIGEFSQPIQSLSELTDIRQQCGEIEEFIGRSLFQMKQVHLSASFISIQQIAHVISKLGSAVLTETPLRSNTSRPSKDSFSSRRNSYNSRLSSRSKNY